VPKGQYKGYTCPRCQRAKVSAQHLRQKEKKKKNGGGASEKPLSGKQDMPNGSDSVRVPAVNVQKQPIMAVHDLLEAILADCITDPATLQPLKNSFKKLLQIQRAFKVLVLISAAGVALQVLMRLVTAGRGRCVGSVLEAFRIQVVSTKLEALD
jgi:hypothetical protein